MDAEEYEFEEPKPKKPKLKKDPHADLERKVREAVLTTPEDWLTPQFLSQDLHAGKKHVVAILDVLVAEGVLSPLQPVPYDEEVKVGVRPISDGFFHINAFRHADRWVIGYFSKSAADARKTVLVHGKPSYDAHRRNLGISRARISGRRYTSRYRSPTPRMKEDFVNSFRYKAADWDGLAHKVLRETPQFAEACKALSLHYGPWICKCGQRNSATAEKCHHWNCKERRPVRSKPEVKAKICPQCGESDVDGHSKRHLGKKLKPAREKCMAKMVEKVHKM